jgi:hypothetical protein
MELIKNLLIDSMNGFSPKYIPLMLLQLLVAALLAWLVQKVINKKIGEKVIENGALIASSVALIVGIAKYSLPFAVIAAATIIVLALKTEMKSKASALGFFLIILVGAACGIGSLIQIVIGTAFISLIVMMTPLKAE